MVAAAVRLTRLEARAPGTSGSVYERAGLADVPRNEQEALRVTADVFE